MNPSTSNDWKESHSIRGGWELDGVGAVVPIGDLWFAVPRHQPRLGPFVTLEAAKVALEHVDDRRRSP